MFKNLSHQKVSRLSTSIKTARFLVPLVVLGKLKIFHRLQTHPKKDHKAQK